GDEVMLVFCDKSIDAWQSEGGEQDPDDARRHHLADAVAYPGLHNNKAAISDASESVITIGKSGETQHPVAWGDTAKDELTALRNTVNSLVSTFNSHMH